MGVSSNVSARGSKGHHTYTLAISEGDYDIANNTSPVSYTFTLIDDNDWFWNNWGTAISYTLTINGENITGSIPVHSTKTQTITSGTKTVTHDANGAKSLTFGFSVTDTSGRSYTSGTASASKSISLTVIPRASSMSLSPADPTTTSTVTAAVTRASTSFTHTITTAYNGTTYTLGTAKFGESTDITIPSGIKTAMKSGNVASVSLPLTLTTYNGTTVIGTKDYSLTVRAPLATVTMSASSVACNANVTWNLANYDTSVCTYTVTRSYNNTVRYTDQTKGTTTSKAVANATFETYITESTSGTVTTKVTTYVGTTEVGSTTVDYTVTIPTGTYKPTLTVASQLAKVTVTSYSNGSAIAFLAGYDGARGTMTEGKASSSHAAITSRVVTITSSMSGITETHSVSSTTATINLPLLPRSDNDYTVTVTYTVTDARGGTASLRFTAITVRGYRKPMFTASSVVRANSTGTVATEGTYANITATAVAHTAKNTSGTEVNKMSTIQFKMGSSAAVSGTVSGLNGTINTTKYNGSLNIAQQYTFTLTATDYLGQSTSISIILPKATVTLSLHKNVGVGLGTVAEQGYVTAGKPIKTTEIRSLTRQYRIVFSDLTITEIRAQGENGTLGTSDTDTSYMKALLKALCIKYPGYRDTTFIGAMNPNSQGKYIVTIYNTSTTNAETGLPQHSYGLYFKYGRLFYKFGTSYDTYGDANVDTTYSAISEAEIIATNNDALRLITGRRFNYGVANYMSTNYGNVENKSSATIRSEITSSNVTTALGYTPAHEASAIWAKPSVGYNLAKSGTYTVPGLTAVRTKGSDLSISSGSIKCAKAGWVRVAAKAWFWGNDGNGNNASGGADQWITKNGTKLEDSKQRFAYAINYFIYSEALINVAANDLIGFTYGEVSGSTRSSLQTMSSYICEYIE